jgi:enamine deaminase RidA (YjgF/YER057c/UK114 family)
MSHQLLQPPGWPRPRGYANGIAASGRMVFTAGVVGWTSEERFEAEDLAGQFRQALLNIKAILAEAGAEPGHLVRITCYVTDRQAYIDELPAIGAAWREVFGKVFPCMAVMAVTALVEAMAKVELEATAVIPETQA